MLSLPPEHTGRMWSTSISSPSVSPHRAHRKPWAAATRHLNPKEIFFLGGADPAPALSPLMARHRGEAECGGAPCRAPGDVADSTMIESSRTYCESIRDFCHSRAQLLARSRLSQVDALLQHVFLVRRRPAD